MKYLKVEVQCPDCEGTADIIISEKEYKYNSGHCNDCDTSYSYDELVIDFLGGATYEQYQNYMNNQQQTLHQK